MKRNTFYGLPVVLKVILVTFLTALIWSCEKDEQDVLLENEDITIAPEVNGDILSREELNKYILSSIKGTDNSFNWNEVPENVLWSALVHSDHQLMIGYKKAEWDDEDTRQYMYENGSLNKSLSGDLFDVKNDIIDGIYDTELEKNKDATKEGVVVRENDQLLSMTIKVDNLETLRSLRASDNIRYMESTYTFYKRESLSKDGFGCGTSSPAVLRNYYDYLTISPGSKIGWNFKYHKIKETWEHGGYLGKGVGKGIGVAIFDTGNSIDQNLLSAAFNSGIVTGRSSSYVDYYEGSSPWDICGHGTALAGVIAAPRTDRGNTIGIAYGCNLQAVKANGDVVINGSKDVSAIAQAFTVKALERNVRIISMSMGSPIYYSEIADAIIFAYKRGKLIFAAAGTIPNGSSISGGNPGLTRLSFPSNMTEYNGDVVMSVTGINTKYGACGECVQGPIVDFAVVMEQMNGTQALALTTYSNEPSTIGGSSVATATMAGIAAIVWGKNPTLPRANLVYALKTASDFPARTSNWFGYGKVNALEAYKAFGN